MIDWGTTCGSRRRRNAMARHYLLGGWELRRIRVFFQQHISAGGAGGATKSDVASDVDAVVFELRADAVLLEGACNQCTQRQHRDLRASA